MTDALTQHRRKDVELRFWGHPLSVHPGASRSFESPPTNVPILMSNPSTRLGALAGQWDVPDPDALKTLLRPEAEIEKRFYDSRLLASEQESSGDRSISENGDAEEQ